MQIYRHNLALLSILHSFKSFLLFYLERLYVNHFLDSHLVFLVPQGSIHGKILKEALLQDVNLDLLNILIQHQIIMHKLRQSLL